MAFVEQDIASIGGAGRGAYPYPVYAGGGNSGIGTDGGFGCWGILLAVIILWLLFSRDGNRGGHGAYGDGIDNSFNRYGFGGFGGFGGNCCSPLDCKIPMAPDMSNCEVDKDIWKVDSHIEKCCCETQKEIHEEGSKTRELIQSNLLAELKEKLCEKNTEVQALKTQQYSDAKFEALYGKLGCYEKENDKEYCKLNNKIDALICDLDCNLPKRPPVYFKGSTVDTHDIDCHDFPRRAFKNDCCNECC